MSETGSSMKQSQTNESLPETPASQAKTPPATSPDEECPKTPDTERVPFIFAGVRNLSSMSSAAGGSTAASAESAGENLESVKILKTWPAVPLVVNKARRAYESVRQSCRVARWGVDAAARAVAMPTVAVLRWLRPAVRLADRAAARGLTRLETALPAVRESPGEVYEDIVRRVNGVVKPLVRALEDTMEIGRSTVRLVVGRAVSSCRSLVTMLDDWMSIIERNVERPATRASEGEAVTPAAEPHPQAARAAARPLGARLRRVVTSAALLATGASVWTLSRVPVARRLVRDIPLRGLGSATQRGGQSGPTAGETQL